jgi:RNA polymerase sigma factor (sigma-70 family)
VRGGPPVTVMGGIAGGLRMASKEFLVRLLKVFEGHGTAILRYLIRRGTRTADAEDILQQVWLVMQNVDERVIADLTKYCFGVARRLAQYRRQQQARRDEVLRRVAGDPASEQAPSALDEALHHADEQRKLKKLWEEAVEALDPVSREVYVCVDVKGMTYNATAHQCELSRSQVARYLAQARDEIERAMCSHQGKDIQ